MRSPRREPWSFWCVLKCSVNWPIRSLSNAICTSGLPVSLGCVPYWSMRDFLCSLANTCLVHSCLLIVCLCDVYRVSRRVGERKGGCASCFRPQESIVLEPSSSSSSPSQPPDRRLARFHR